MLNCTEITCTHKHMHTDLSHFLKVRIFMLAVFFPLLYKNLFPIAIGTLVFQGLINECMFKLSISFKMLITLILSPSPFATKAK